MTNILCFEKDGVLYAKGFINQEGLSLYVLPGYRDVLEEALERVGQCEVWVPIEETPELPGEGHFETAPEPVPDGEFPCGHPHNGDDICSGLHCNDDLEF